MQDLTPGTRTETSRRQALPRIFLRPSRIRSSPSSNALTSWWRAFAEVLLAVLVEVRIRVGGDRLARTSPRGSRPRRPRRCDSSARARSRRCVRRGRGRRGRSCRRRNRLRAAARGASPCSAAVPGGCVRATSAGCTTRGDAGELRGPRSRSSVSPCPSLLPAKAARISSRTRSRMPSRTSSLLATCL